MPRLELMLHEGHYEDLLDALIQRNPHHSEKLVEMFGKLLADVGLSDDDDDWSISLENLSRVDPYDWLLGYCNAVDD